MASWWRHFGKKHFDPSKNRFVFEDPIQAALLAKCFVDHVFEWTHISLKQKEDEEWFKLLWDQGVIRKSAYIGWLEGGAYKNLYPGKEHLMSVKYVVENLRLKSKTQSVYSSKEWEARAREKKRTAGKKMSQAARQKARGQSGVSWKRKKKQKKM